MSDNTAVQPKLFSVLVDALNSKERTAKVYAATLRRIHREVYKKELADMSLKFTRSTKVLNYVKKIVNLTRRKNAATAVVMGLRATDGPPKMLAKFRKIMLDADKDYQKFLTSGKRKRPFDNAEKAWELVTSLHRKVSKEIDALSLWSVGSKVDPGEYRILMAWIYLKWLAALPPRRLEYAETRLLTKAQFDALPKKTGNYVVMGKRKWTWNLYKFKTVEKYGPAIIPIPGPLKAALNKLLPIINAKSEKGLVFQNNKFRQLSRSQFSTFVSWVFRKYANKKWTQNTIRAIKVSSVWKPNVENPLQLAEKMGHSLETALLHYKQ